jgi:AraC-like DNA-binding protein
MAGIGHFFAWDGGCVLIGRHTRPVPPHSHQAIQIVFGVDTPVKLRGRENDEWQEYPIAIIPSRQPHELDATAAEYGAVILVEPETREGRALTELYLRDGIASVDDGTLATLIHALFDTWREQPSATAVSRAVWAVLRSLTRGIQPSVITDPRIERAVAYINVNLSGPLTLDDVAKQAYLSPSRFRHLFVEQTGMALRPYILWRRFLTVWELLMAGDTLSMAAHVAGFADAAHLTRTSRRMFGLAPSAIQIVSPLPARERGSSPSLT